MAEKHKLRVIAMYLPQFHRILENDMWWGKGYTEWTAVKNARPLYHGHMQPRVPLHENYYDLLDTKVMEWQASLAKKYSVDGFCFYHYWFGDGRKILEKPAENLLQEKHIDMPFCFCWDPSTWARTWTKIGNSWADAFEKKEEGTSTGKGVLIRQDFGDEATWKKHFEYLLPFFQDKRYIKFNGAPVFLFYASSEIACFERMASFWRNMAKKSGFKDLYIVAMHTPNLAADAVIVPMAFHPSTLGYDDAVGRCAIGETSLRGYDYDEVWKNYLEYIPSAQQKTLWLCTVSFDDTPRRGLNGRLYLNVSPKKFKKYYALLVEKSLAEKTPFLFIDAWNEWGEGKYLEPDSDYRYSFLEAIRDVMNMDTHQLEEFKIHQTEKCSAGKLTYIANLQKQICEYRKMYLCMLRWQQLNMSKFSIAEYLWSQGYKTTAIYGFGVHGHLLFEDLKRNHFEIRYVIDICKEEMSGRESIPVYSLQDKLPQCDVIIVSLIESFWDIFHALHSKVDLPILSLYEVIQGALNMSE